MRKCVFVLIGSILFFGSDVFAIEVGSIADTRFESGWTLDGSEMTRTRDKLLATSNFGPGGTVPEAINITDVAGPIDFTVLSQFDVFFIGYFADSSPDAFSTAELDAFHDWVDAGGTMVISCDNPTHDVVCTWFGPVPSDMDANPPVTATVAGSSGPVFDGPFGMPAALEMSGIAKYFEDTGGFVVLGRDQDLNPVLLEDTVGSGRVIAFTDVDMISDRTVSQGNGITNDNDRFLGNLFAYLADEAVETFFINAGLNGNWWNGPGRSGEGAQFEVSDGGGGNILVVATVYSYDNAGNQIFLIATGPADGNTANVNVFITDGGLWGEDFDPALVNESAWGTGTFSADHCGLIHMMLVPNATYQNAGYTNLEYDLVRLTYPLAPCPIANPVQLIVR